MVGPGIIILKSPSHKKVNAPYFISYINQDVVLYV